MTKFLTQVSVLTSHTEDPEVRASVEDQVTTSGGAFVLRVENPCHDPDFCVHGYRLCEFYMHGLVVNARHFVIIVECIKYRQ